MKWHHGHSLATGVLVGLLVSYRPWLVFAAGVLVGILVVAVRNSGRRLLATVERLARRGL
jgi:hypothetical protein